MKGFSGDAAQRYYGIVDKALSDGKRCIMAGKGAKKSLINGKSLDRIASQHLSYIDRNTVALNDEIIYYVASEQSKQEDDFLGKVNYVIDRLEKLCSEKYIIPSATPKVLDKLRVLKQSLETSYQTSQQGQNILNSYASKIVQADV